MGKNYILTKIAAFGFCDNCENPEEREDIVQQALASFRLFGDGRLKVQPILIRGKAHSRGWSREYLEKSMAMSCFGFFYQLTIDDEKISQSNLLDAIYAALALMEHVDDGMLLIPIDPTKIPKNRTITTEDAAEIYKVTLPYTSSSYDYESLFSTQWHSTCQFDQNLWEVVWRIMDDEQVIYACNFLMTSYAEYQFMGDSIGEVILAHEEVPQQINEAVKLENAIHNCYKVVEGIYGGTLPTSQKKVKNKLESIGIYPDELVGYETYGVFKKEKIITKIESLRSARNEKAAHGRIHKDRKSTYYELMEYQALANYLLAGFLRHKYPDVPI